MTRLVDVVNFNADASCLAAKEWLAILRGGPQSRLCQWLSLYVELQRPVVLGFIGAAIADMAMFNREAIALITSNQDIFGLVLRPFSHDVGLLRSKQGFITNLTLGRAVARREFPETVDYFLPPEFMLTNSQVKILADSGITGTFVNSSRLNDEMRDRLPLEPFVVEGVLGSQLACIPFTGSLTRSYLDSMHNLDSKSWADALASLDAHLVFMWRDGESCFLVPDGIARERHWLASEPPIVRRETLKAALKDLRFDVPAGLPSVAALSYPPHSFTAWFKEFRMFGFLDRLALIEARVNSLSKDQIVTWLQAINSDVLSAIEKDSPVVSLASISGDSKGRKIHTIWRSQRGFEGEDYLALLEQSIDSPSTLEGNLSSSKAHLVKLRARIEYVRGLAVDWHACL